MDDMAFTDALTGHVIAVSADGGAARVVEKRPVEDAPSVFFPGCSMVNYAPALVSVMADYLAGAGIAQGVSLLCCGKILDFEEGGAARRDTVDEKMREAFARAGVHRIVAACPNCSAALRRALAAPGAPAIEVVPLSRALADAGCRIEEGAIARTLAAKGLTCDGGALLWVHDSCPDRGAYGFGSGMRELLPAAALIEENLKPASRCCGSTARAAGRFEAALSQGARRADEAASCGADALVCGCMSCAASRTMAQETLPVVHYLEFLCEYPMDWRALARPMALRFLLEGRAAPEGEGGRGFIDLARDAEAGR